MSDPVVIPAPEGTRLLFVSPKGDDIRWGSHVFAFAISPTSKLFYAVTSGSWVPLHTPLKDDWMLHLLMPGGGVQTKDYLYKDITALRDAMQLAASTP